MGDTLFSQTPESEFIDPLTKGYAPERVNYATGVMLQADDFLAEQTYHRGRLATLLRHMVGFGTLAGLRVVAPPVANNLIEIRVDPGLAVDRHGRLIEVQTPYCINIARWMLAQQMEQLFTATHNAPNLPAESGIDKAVVADVFLSAQACGRGMTPSFASGPFDALDALVAARMAENPKLELVLRAEPPGGIPNPENFWPTPSTGGGAGNVAAAAKARLDAVLGSWDVGTSDALDDSLAPLVEHVPGRDTSAILLARIAIPVKADIVAGKTITRLNSAQNIHIDNSIRPIIFFPGKWFGRSLSTPPSA